MPESITIFSGQGGCQTGNAVWELFTAEHSISPDGRPNNKNPTNTKSPESTFFVESSSGRMVPRCLFTDLENGVINEIRVGNYRSLFHSNCLINGTEDAANIFARGYWSQGSQLIGKFMNQLRIVVEECDSCQSVIGLHSSGGGTGSGFSALQFDEICDLYPKMCKIEASLFPIGIFSTNMVEPYNALLAAHYTMNNVDVNFLWDNNALYSVASKMLGLENPSYAHINRLTSQVFSSMTCCSRFGGPLTGHMIHYQTNLVPYPRIHFPITSYSPIQELNKFDREPCNIKSITYPLFKSSSQFSSINVEAGCFVSCCLIYRGCVSHSDVYKCLGQLKSDNLVNFVDWCPTGVKVTICDMAPTIIPSSRLSVSDKNVMLMSNSSAIAQVFDALLKKFSHLYCKRAFVHWYVGEGMEEGEFSDAITNISTLIEDYSACFSPEGVTPDHFEKSQAKLTKKTKHVKMSPDPVASKHPSPTSQEQGNNDEDQEEDEEDSPEKKSPEESQNDEVTQDEVSQTE